MDRRHYLALVGSGLALSTAGCAGGDDDNGGDNGGDDSSNGGESGSENSNDNEDGEKGEDDSGTDSEEIAFGQTLDLTLESGDGEDPAYNDLAKPVLFEASAGDEVTITQTSDAFDAYLMVEGPSGSVVAESDDGDGIGLNSRVSTTLTESGEYTIWPGSFSGSDTGPFTLSLEEGLYSGDGTDDGDDSSDDDNGVTQPETQSFSGSGESVEQGITIEGGLTVVEATHDGSSNFQVTLEDDSEYGELFVNVIGGFDGAQAAYVDSGEYLLDVTGDGEWTVDIVQPRASSGDELPQSFSGDSPAVVGPLEFSGTGIATGTHEGEGNFQVAIFEQGGTFQTLVFNEIGEFEGETTYNASGVGWVDINADGSWSLEIE